MLDREIAFGLIVAVIGTLVVSSFYFSEPTSQARGQDVIESTYASEDIRYPLQMAEKKSKAKTRKHKVAPTPPPEPEAYYDEDPEGATGDSDIEQPPAEEPEIE